MPQAGYCSECNANVWLAPDGSCTNGHPASSVMNAYETPGPGQAPITATPSKSRTGLIIGIVIGALLLCLVVPVLIAIAVPVFMNASGNAQEKACFANQRMVVGAYAMYATSEEDYSVPNDWDELMSLLLGSSYLKAEPACPAEGYYSSEPDGIGGVSISCSEHGRAIDRPLP